MSALPGRVRRASAGHSTRRQASPAASPFRRAPAALQRPRTSRYFLFRWRFPRVAFVGEVTGCHRGMRPLDALFTSSPTRWSVVMRRRRARGGTSRLWPSCRCQPKNRATSLSGATCPSTPARLTGTKDTGRAPYLPARSGLEQGYGAGNRSAPPRVFCLVKAARDVPARAPGSRGVSLPGMLARVGVRSRPAQPPGTSGFTRARVAAAEPILTSA